MARGCRGVIGKEPSWIKRATNRNRRSSAILMPATMPTGSSSGPDIGSAFELNWNGDSGGGNETRTWTMATERRKVRRPETKTKDLDPVVPRFRPAPELNKPRGVVGALGQRRAPPSGVLGLFLVVFMVAATRWTVTALRANAELSRQGDGNAGRFSKIGSRYAKASRDSPSAYFEAGTSPWLVPSHRTRSRSTPGCGVGRRLGRLPL